MGEAGYSKALSLVGTSWGSAHRPGCTLPRERCVGVSSCSLKDEDQFPPLLQRDSAFLGQAVRQAHACHRAGVTAGLGEEENPSTVQSIFHLMPAPCKSKLQSRVRLGCLGERGRQRISVNPADTCCSADRSPRAGWKLPLALLRLSCLCGSSRQGCSAA